MFAFVRPLWRLATWIPRKCAARAMRFFHAADQREVVRILKRYIADCGQVFHPVPDSDGKRLKIRLPAIEILQEQRPDGYSYEITLDGFSGVWIHPGDGTYADCQHLWMQLQSPDFEPQPRGDPRSTEHP